MSVLCISPERASCFGEIVKDHDRYVCKPCIGLGKQSTGTQSCISIHTLISGFNSIDLNRNSNSSLADGINKSFTFHCFILYLINIYDCIDHILHRGSLYHKLLQFCHNIDFFFSSLIICFTIFSMYSLSVAAKTTMVLFPLLALTATVPFMISQYRKHGSVSPYRYIVVFSFLLYLMMCYFLVILPLPDKNTVYSSPGYNLKLFSYLPEIARQFDFSSTDGILYFLRHAVFLEPVLNVIMLIPFGIYLRYYYHRPFLQVFLLSFGMSLFFELTQLSGLYGIYDIPYRLFDVNDLLENTLGGVIGYIMTPVFIAILPSLHQIDRYAQKKGNTVTLTRRLIAFGIDDMICVAITLLILHLASYRLDWKVITSIYVICYVFFLLQQIIFTGKTVGRQTVRITILDQCGDKPKLWQLLIRNFIRVTVLMQGYLLFPLCNCLPSGYEAIGTILCFLLIMAVWIFLVVDCISATLRRHRAKVLYYEILTHSMCVSTLSLSSSIQTTRMEVNDQLDQQ